MICFESQSKKASYKISYCAEMSSGLFKKQAFIFFSFSHSVGR